MRFLILNWILGAIAVYRLWGEHIWLSILVIILVLTYGAHSNEQLHHEVTGMYDNLTATRLMWTTIIIIGIFLYSLFA